MKVQKYEISRTIDKLKSIVQKNDQFPALGGVLVKDGYLIASNTEMTMQLKLEASKGSCFIIPMKAFDVIKNLPDGEVIIDADGKNIVTIKTKAIKNKYQSYPPEEFSFDITEDLDAPEVVINGKRMMEAIGHVIYAAADSSSATQMMGVYFEGGENKIKLVALDGHVVAVDSIPTDGTADMKLIVPKTVAKKLVSMGIIDDVAVTYTKNRAVFKSKEYTIYTRLIEGKYFDYNRFFMAGKMKHDVSYRERGPRTPGEKPLSLLRRRTYILHGCVEISGSRKIMEDIAGNKMGLRRAIEIVRGGGLNEISRKNVY